MEGDMGQYDNLDAVEQNRVSLTRFTVFVLISQVLALSIVVITGVWLGEFSTGFAWQSDPDREFNFHPLFMILGMIFMYGESILVYRVFRNQRKRSVKALHAILHVLALVFAGVGLKAVFDSHNLKGKNNLYSLHGWLGIVTVSLFGLQWISGFVSFLFPRLPDRPRALYKPTHVFWGLAIFLMACATALMGITEDNLFHAVPGYYSYSTRGILSNTLGLLIVMLALTICYIVTNENYQRPPDPLDDDESLPLK